MNHANHSGYGVVLLGINETRDDPVAGRGVRNHYRFPVQAANPVGTIGERGDVDGRL
jgi:hypothetical protein